MHQSINQSINQSIRHAIKERAISNIFLPLRQVKYKFLNLWTITNTVMTTGSNSFKQCLTHLSVASVGHSSTQGQVMGTARQQALHDTPLLCFTGRLLVRRDEHLLLQHWTWMAHTIVIQQFHRSRCRHWTLGIVLGLPSLLVVAAVAVVAGRMRREMEENDTSVV